ncbi:hypothetical protein GCM10022252_46720 [Streptosporangium oxazolinicum]|uniref:Secreted protein n=1 Tax=Streptosporangium oxazolinicum TaxID=909287 RepID=A0ABP8B599_9ACTN
MTRATVFLLVAMGTVRRLKSNGLRPHSGAGAEPGPHPRGDGHHTDEESRIGGGEPDPRRTRGKRPGRLRATRTKRVGEREHAGNGEHMDAEAGLAHMYVASATMATSADEPPPDGSNASRIGRTAVANPPRRPRAHRSGT